MSGKSKRLKIILIGDYSTGKTALMERFAYNRYDSYSRSTIGVDFRDKHVYVNGKMYTLQIWDTAGQERFESITRQVYKGSDCCLLTFALDDLHSFENLSRWKHAFLRYADIPDGNNFPFVIVGNKVDNVDNRVVKKRMVRDWCNQNGINFCHYYETSAKVATNVHEAFIAAVERYKELETIAKEGTDTVVLSKKPNQERKCCKTN
jgi:small GTP-binding protein